MRLPGREEVRGSDQRHVYECDLREWHSRNRIRETRYRYRIRRMVSLAEHYAQGPKVLEIGCAQANIATLLAERGFVSTALDLRLGFLQYARLKRTHGRIQYVVASGDTVPFSRYSFDVIVLGELLEHVVWPEQFLANAQQMLGPGGIIIVSTPNGQHRWNNLPTYSEVQNSRSAFEFRQFGPDGDSHLFLYTPSELTLLLERSGFDIVHLEVHDFDLVRRISNRLSSLRVWHNPIMLAATHPLGWILTRSDRLFQHLPRPLRWQLAQGIIAVGRCVQPRAKSHEVAGVPGAIAADESPLAATTS